MKKIIIVIFIVLLLFIGYVMTKKQNDFTTIDNQKAQDIADRFIEANYKNIKKIDYEKLERLQMRGINLDGVVNDKYKFSVGFNEKFSVETFVEENGFPEKKEACKDKFCDY